MRNVKDVIHSPAAASALCCRRMERRWMNSKVSGEGKIMNKKRRRKEETETVDRREEHECVARRLIEEQC
jgi:hypothetical protein